jgi:type IV fimbrial biogenesis protein FimT
MSTQPAAASPRLQPGARPKPPAAALRHGFTLVELVVTLAIAAILMALAVPSMREYIARKRVEGVASELATDLRAMRNAPLESGLEPTVQVRFGTTPTHTCYVVYVLLVPQNAMGADTRCDCTARPICPVNLADAGQAIKLVELPLSRGVEISAIPTSLAMRHGGMPIGGATLTATVRSELGGAVRVSTNALGRASTCSVSGSNSTFAACPP